MYRERPSRIPGAVVWQTTASTDAAIRVLPDGCMDLIWDGERLLVAGPDTRAQLFSLPSGSQRHGLRFAPGVGPSVVGVPASALLCERVPIDALWGEAEARRITERFATCSDPTRTLEAVARLRSPAADRTTALTHRIAELAAQARTGTEIASAVGLGSRQLHRHCTAAFGYGSKTLVRILRLQRALALARSGVAFAVAAIETGYADQSHLARDVKDLTGVTLRRLTR